MTQPPDVSVVIVSFNTWSLLEQSLERVTGQTGLASLETIVVDCASRDGSADRVAERFPAVRLIRAAENLGFGPANNLGFEVATGRYLVLLNSDAFLAPDTLAGAVALMERHPGAGIGGARLVGEDGAPQPSARAFPSLWRDALVMSGLAARYPHSRVWGAPDRSWADPGVAAQVDWVPGAFMIAPRALIQQLGGFDPRFFLYYEEVDLCRRVRAAGKAVWYWPSLEVVHVGGASSRTVTEQVWSETGAQLERWRMRSRFLYYRKHHGAGAWRAWQLERGYFHLRAWRNARRGLGERAEAFRRLAGLCDAAWRETKGGRVSPPAPW